MTVEGDAEAVEVPSEVTIDLRWMYVVNGHQTFCSIQRH